MPVIFSDPAATNTILFARTPPSNTILLAGKYPHICRDPYDLAWTWVFSQHTDMLKFGLSPLRRILSLQPFNQTTLQEMYAEIAVLSYFQLGKIFLKTDC